MLARRLPLLALIAVTALAGPARADKLDKDAKKWLEDVAPLILPEEEKTFRNLKDKADRDEFQKIFWARRNPQGPAAADNPARTEYEKLRPTLEQRFKVPGKPGTATDCARVIVLLGEPNEVKQDTSGEVFGSRKPEVWTFKDRPGFTFSGGQIQVAFDAACQVPPTSRFVEQLNRPAEVRIVNPNIGYKQTRDGHLVKLVEQLPKPSPAQALLTEPRQDFPLAAQPKMLVRGKEGATYIGGLVRAEAGGLSVREETGKKTATLVVAAQALDEAGNVVASTEQETSAEVGADGAVIGSYGLTLKPGKYTLRVGALDPKSNKGSVASLPVEMPDFGSGGLAMADLLVLSDVREHPAQDPKDPLAAFFMGTAQLIPRFGNAFSKSESIQVLGFVYNLDPDPATGKAQAMARFQILRDGRPVTAPSEDQSLDGPIATPGIGPVPLERFSPGKYVVQLKVSDKAAKKDYVKEASFEVTP